MFTKNAKIDLLRQVPLFAECSRRELGEVASVADEIHFPAGRTLMTEGEAGRELVVIVDGTVEVTRDGRLVPLKGGATFFGEIALLTGAPRNATVTTASPVRALVIDSRAFDRLLAESSTIQRKVLSGLAARVSDTD